MAHILILGGGAAGLAAALAAAQTDSTARVTVLERSPRPGKKLLATGNGRCNLTNTGAAPENYLGAQPEFAARTLAAFPPAATLDWFAAHGLLTVTEPGGRVYPLSNAANSVVDVLRFALAQPNITLHTGDAVTAVRRQGRDFVVETEGGQFPAARVIIACGGIAGAKAGGVRDGYTLLQSLGHQRTALHPALVQLTTEPTYPRALKGVRADARVTLLQGRKVLARSAGEVQFTEKGVSGPAIFEISRAASCSGEGQTVTLDLLRAHSAPEFLAFLQTRRKLAPALPCEEVLTGTVHNRVGKMLLRYADIPGARPLGDVTDAELKALVRAAKGFALPVRGTEGFESAQVTAGGMRTDEFDPVTMESRLVPGLYACGEVLDIDGDCGGYNLQWAWASGRAAGRACR